MKEHQLLMPFEGDFEIRNVEISSNYSGYQMKPKWNPKTSTLSVPFFGTQGKVRFEARGRLALGEFGTLLGKPAIETFDALSNEVEGIIRAVEAETAQLK